MLTLGSSQRLAAVHQIGRTQHRLTTTLRRLSSGRRVNSASDDAARAAIAENLDAQVRGHRTAGHNAMRGFAIAQVADGASASVGDMLKRLRELAVQAGSETYTDDERAMIHTEAAGILVDIDRMAANTEFAGTALTNASVASIGVQVGIGNSANDTITIQTGDLRAATLGVAGVDLQSVADALTAIGDIDTAMDTVSSYRSRYGASMNRLEAAASHASVQEESLASAMSRMVDADMAFEASELARLRILQSAGVAALGASNRIDRQATLRLLGA